MDQTENLWCKSILPVNDERKLIIKPDVLATIKIAKPSIGLLDSHEPSKAKMKACVISRVPGNQGQPSSALYVDEAFPRAFICKDGGEVLVRVVAASVSYKQLRQLRGDFDSVRLSPFAKSVPEILGGDVRYVFD